MTGIELMPMIVDTGRKKVFYLLVRCSPQFYFDGAITHMIKIASYAQKMQIRRFTGRQLLPLLVVFRPIGSQILLTIYDWIVVGHTTVFTTIWYD
jgi:hypothetical protein